MPITSADLQGHWILQHDNLDVQSFLDFTGNYFKKVVLVNGKLTDECDNGKFEIKNLARNIVHIYLHPGIPSDTIVLTNVLLDNNILTYTESDSGENRLYRRFPILKRKGK